MRTFVKNLFRKKLTYTNEMRTQDNLWYDENEDKELMQLMHNTVLAEARKKGFSGYIYQYNLGHEFATEVYKNKQHYNFECDYGSSEIECFGKIEALIDYLEKIINNEIDYLRYYSSEDIETMMAYPLD